MVAISGLIAALGTLIIVLIPAWRDLSGWPLDWRRRRDVLPSNWALGTDLVPNRKPGGIWASRTGWRGAGAVGAYIGGPIADFFTNTAPNTPGVGYVLLYTIYGLLFLASVFILQKIHLPK
jgi:hypothetical protein